MGNALNLIDSMNIIRCIGLLGLVFITSCQNIEEVKEPKNLLSKSEMKDLIYDMVLLDAAAVVNDEPLKELDVEMLEFLSKKYDLDSTDLKQNILYYNLKYSDNIEIYENAKDSIDKLKNAYDSISNARDSLRKLEKKRLDSIKKIDTISKNKTLQELKIKD